MGMLAVKRPLSNQYAIETLKIWYVLYAVTYFEKAYLFVQLS